MGKNESYFNKKQLQEFRDRWKLVDTAEIAELRRTPAEQKLRQLAALMASASIFETAAARAADDEAAREHWKSMRQRLHVQR